MLNICNINKSFNEKCVLNGLSLEVADHTIFGLVGVNGAGKSTLLRIIGGIIKSDSGFVHFDDFDTCYDEMIRKDILYVSDDLYYGRVTTINSLKEFYKTFYDFDEKLYQHYLRTFKLNPAQNIHNFSKGMKRQVYLMMALAIKPKLLLLDEAFDGLDPLIRLEIKKGLIDLTLEKDSTIIISSHNLKELQDICDSFGILDEGVIKTSGELMTSLDSINKYQIVFSEAKELNEFIDLDILRSKVSGRVIELVIKGEKEEVLNKLNEHAPLLVDVLPTDFEELFIYEMESRGKVHE